MVFSENTDIPVGSLVLPERLKGRIGRIIHEHRQQEKLKSHGLSNRRKILLVGPPGTGKTMTARVLAHELRLTLHTIQVDKLDDQIHGGDQRQARRIFDLIRDETGAYLFDEFDAIAGERSFDNDVGEMRRVLNALLQFIEQDASDSLIIGATNSPGCLTGRFSAGLTTFFTTTFRTLPRGGDLSRTSWGPSRGRPSHGKKQSKRARRSVTRKIRHAATRSRVDFTGPAGCQRGRPVEGPQRAPPDPPEITPYGRRALSAHFPGGTNAFRRFTSPQRGGANPRIPVRNRAQHARFVEERLRAAWQAAEDRQAVAHADRRGVYLDFYSEPGFDLMLKSLEARGSGISLLNARKEGTGVEERTRATVYIPREKSAYFLRKVSAYANETLVPRKEGGEAKPKNAKLVESIADVRGAVLASFWQDQQRFLPGDAPDWVEAWLSSEDLGVIERFQALCHAEQIEMGQGRFAFPERTVCLVNASHDGLTRLLELSDDIAEFRSAKEVATFFIEQENRDQAQWVTDLLDRTEVRDREHICVLVLDHGVNNGHRLLEPILPDEDRHTVEPAWGINDDQGHGTLMAGTAAYGDLLAILQSDAAVIITHGLESAKILPPPPATNPKRLWGHYTGQGISLAEIQAPARKRITCMAVTSADDRDRGRPSSWSGKVDELASGYDDDTRRLIIVSAGNITDPNEWRGYPESNLTNEVHDPAQAWNVLTVGAFTTKTQIRDRTLAGFTAKAEAGSLSPFSTTFL